MNSKRKYLCDTIQLAIKDKQNICWISLLNILPTVVIKYYLTISEHSTIFTTHSMVTVTPLMQGAMIYQRESWLSCLEGDMVGGHINNELCHNILLMLYCIIKSVHFFCRLDISAINKFTHID
jgi:hypothetical protein